MACQVIPHVTKFCIFWVITILKSTERGSFTHIHLPTKSQFAIAKRDLFDTGAKGLGLVCVQLSARLGFFLTRQSRGC